MLPVRALLPYDLTQGSGTYGYGGYGGAINSAALAGFDHQGKLGIEPGIAW